MRNELHEYQREALERLRRHHDGQIMRTTNPPMVYDTETRSVRPMEFQQQISGRWTSQMEQLQSIPRSVRDGQVPQRRYWTVDEPRPLTAEDLRRARDLMERAVQHPQYQEMIHDSIVFGQGSYNLDEIMKDIMDKEPTKKKEEKPWLD